MKQNIVTNLALFSISLMLLVPCVHSQVKVNIEGATLEPYEYDPPASDARFVSILNEIDSLTPGEARMVLNSLPALSGYPSVMGYELAIRDVLVSKTSGQEDANGGLDQIKTEHITIRIISFIVGLIRCLFGDAIACCATIVSCVEGVCQCLK